MRECFVERIKQEEGFRQYPYWDNKQWTNGYGTEAKHEIEVITREEAEKRLINMIKVSEMEVAKMFPKTSFTTVRFEAIVDMVYNLGLPTFKKFKNMETAIRDKDWYRASFEALDSKWFSQVGDRALRIVKEIAKGE